LLHDGGVGGISNIGNDNMQSVVVGQTFWHDKQDISKHHKDNKDFSGFVKRSAPFFMRMPEEWINLYWNLQL
jgi:hypothetical protein